MDVFEAIEKRRSIRKFKTKPVPAKDLKRILEAGRLAPSGGNRQPWSFVVVRDPNRKKELAAASNLQWFIADADMVLVALGDPGISRNLYRQDTMIALEHMVLAAASLGYGSCWIGAFKEEDIKKIAGIPENIAVVAVLPIGVPDEDPPQRPRKALKEIFFAESYSKPLEI